MKDWFRFLRLKQYESAVRQYINDNYIGNKTSADGINKVGETEIPKTDTKSKSAASADSNGVKYSLRSKPGDNFDDSRFKKVIRSMDYETETGKISGMLGNLLNRTFVDKLREYISIKNIRESDLYKSALMDRRLFSKIINDREYKPSKDTALALILALELTVEEAKDMLERAGYVLSHSCMRDVIIEYFISEGICNIVDINEILYRLDQKIIGR